MSKYWVWGLILGLVLLHQDVWFWTDDRLVFGFLPVGLFYHICLSIVSCSQIRLATGFGGTDGRRIQCGIDREGLSIPMYENTPEA